VWTTNALNAVGVGFILRWRAYSINATDATWVHPPAAWTTHAPSASDGILFYLANTIRTPYLDIRWFFYGAQVEVRYVLTKPLEPLDGTTSNITTDLVILKGRQASHSNTGQARVRHTVTFRVPPTQTCQTPFVEEGTVHLGDVGSSSFPDYQWGVASGTEDRRFILTFRNRQWQQVGGQCAWGCGRAGFKPWRSQSNCRQSKRICHPVAAYARRPESGKLRGYLHSPQ